MNLARVAPKVLLVSKHREIQIQKATQGGELSFDWSCLKSFPLGEKRIQNKQVKTCLTLPCIHTSFSFGSDFSVFKKGGFPKPPWDNMVHVEKPALHPFHPGLFLPSHTFKWSWAFSASNNLQIKAGSRAHKHFPSRSSLSSKQPNNLPFYASAPCFFA